MNSAHEQQTRLAKKDNMNKSNKTGIPFQLKAKYEALSGFSFDDVRVHYHSDKPAQLQALAYTQGNHVYIGPGQETHLEHELGHVVQQKQGIVHPTKIVNKLPLNDDPKLEAQSDAMVQGTPVMQRRAVEQCNSNMTVQLFKFQGIACSTLKDLIDRIGLLGTPENEELNHKLKILGLLLGRTDIELSMCEDITEEDWDEKGDELLASLYSFAIAEIKRDSFKILKEIYKLAKENYVFPLPTTKSLKAKNTEFFFDSLCYYLPLPIVNAVRDLLFVPSNLTFLHALKFHDEMPREDFSSEEGHENIDPTDINESFDSSRSCVITALLYAENEVFGVKKPKKLHEILVTYFSDYSSSKDESFPNIKNNVWRNYSDDHVYPSLYKYLGYEQIGEQDLPESINSIPYKIPAKSKKKIDQQPNILAGTKGIIVVKGHAIGYRCDASSVLKLKDNIYKEDTGAIKSRYGTYTIIAIYKKK